MRTKCPYINVIANEISPILQRLAQSNRAPITYTDLVFGGQAHFEWFEGVRVQDFLAEKISPDKMRIVKF